MITGISLCSGGGLAALGMAAAGVDLVGAVEYDPAIAAVYAANLGDHVLIAPLEDTDPRAYCGTDILQVSTPCTRASQAATGATESAVDLALAAAVARYLTTIRPAYFWLENVVEYSRFTAYTTIRAALDTLGYWSHAAVINSQHYGVPQTRRRLILRATRAGLLAPLPAPVPAGGWYAAIADLIPTLPESAFAPWQDAYRPLAPAQPYIVNRNRDKYGPGYRWADQPMFTVSTHSGERWHTWLAEGHVVCMIPRALARFQSVPDSYTLPTSNALACKVIGNGVPVTVAQRVTESLLGYEEVRDAA